jgi:perosamine synthetase
LNEKLLCLHDKTFLDAIQVINLNGQGMVFIVDQENKLHGVLTDGDIRRFILEGRNLQEPIRTVLKKDFVYSTDDEPLASRLAKLTERIKFLPIVDKDFHLVDYIEFKSDVHVPIISPDLRGNELKYLVDAFLSTWISSSGKYIADFEDQFARFCGCPHGVATSNGTTALHLALLACGVGPGDEVIVPDLTFAATANVVFHAGAKPVIVDIEEESWCIDPQEIEKAITPRTRAIIPVHLYGQPCDMGKIMAIARKHKLFVIEDCAEAHGARFEGKRVGSFGDVGCFSFFGNKVITTGEGGMCVTNSSELNDRMRILRDHGMSRTKKYWHDVIGFNYRMTNLQAAIGLAQLERIDSILKQRQDVEYEYRRVLSDVPSIAFQHDHLPGREKITWLVTALVEGDRRDRYIEKFKENAIDVRPLFYPLSSMPIYQDFVFSNHTAQGISRAGISFPTGVSVDPAVLDRIRNILLSNKEKGLPSERRN